MARGPIPDYPADRPTVPDVLPMVQGYLAEHWNGGEFHVALVDGNTQAAFFAGAVSSDDPEVAEIARALMAMTPTQRAKVYKIVNAAGWAFEAS